MAEWKYKKRVLFCIMKLLSLGEAKVLAEACILTIFD